MNAPLLLTDRHDEGYAILTLNRPQARNALSHALRAELAAAVRRLQAEPDVRVLILTGAGPAFCAGLDLKEFAADDGSRSFADAFATVPMSEPLLALRHYPGPVIGAINGAAATGGLELALACDFLIASESASFADTHARVGVLPSWGLSQKLSRLIGLGRAKELSLTGNFLDARQAAAWGLVNRVVAPGQLLAEAERLARDMLGAAPGMLTSYKRLIDDGYALNLAEAMALEQRVSQASHQALNAAEVGRRRAELQVRVNKET